ncbi:MULTISPECIES: hypothetical protein [Vibrio harveyi group]|uniref:hypothetical protein n=1 Tax=Vibrio harveyi group TaxID=717610 RepID=UPI001120B1AB|nr:hypothetical protein [Vibrio parahaemolyticus]MDF4655821.1 hypothetical protein [Vibrio parahaemolyticus]TOI65117.1 hypothetical protein CGI55_08500 [Vibrio parahaemolyticus]
MFDNRDLQHIVKEINYKRFDCLEFKAENLEGVFREEYRFRIYSSRYSINKISSKDRKNGTYILLLTDYRDEDDNEIIVEDCAFGDVENIYKFFDYYSQVLEMQKKIDDLETEMINLFD